MSNENIEQFLKEHSDIVEAYILVNELKVYLNCKNDFQPSVTIKVYKNTILERQPYTFKLSHYIKTPAQAGVYIPSITSYDTEIMAIDQAIKSLTTFINSAIAEGYTASEDWLIPNQSWY
ncbi:hypothetical protein H6G41_32410 [Tolypothrix sp. FACHB-123]|uniref:hypothetical protein n=1 Tax=Tolypothrix sp. FACHB-123 TaxID=2692868 RepID=UPI001682EBC8|nr:hypothetical protein [Tolypothrix sp. FACHB-123]MBD2359235.1 hypothetical protein [Tolypothrix sp. FACHB-123]